ncbi:hypothetical protein V6N12_041852 [Hibiscus sabdariffa]|uniref:Uncharacterized protein n=1 Tax=Hibiscus sabdariffa TaxID=183260 RepID=A0ABR2EFB7_9ROSI
MSLTLAEIGAERGGGKENRKPLALPAKAETAVNGEIEDAVWSGFARGSRWRQQRDERSSDGRRIVQKQWVSDGGSAGISRRTAGRLGEWTEGFGSGDHGGSVGGGSNNARSAVAGIEWWPG